MPNINNLDIIQLINNWHTRASLDDPFSEFVFEYLAFIAYLKRKLFIDARDDQNAIQKLKQNDMFKEKYLYQIKSNKTLRKEWQTIIKELNKISLGNVSHNSNEIEEIRWWNYTGEYLMNQSELDRNRKKGVIHGLNDWGNMVQLWYSIRNNLFHGGKDPQNERDQLLAEKGFKTLHALVDIFLSDRSYL